MFIIQNRKQLVGYLAKAGAPVIALDGWYSSGKSWLGRTVAFCAKRTWIDLDDLLKRDQRAYVDHLNLAQLQAEIDRGSGIVISGVCMREVLSRIRPPATVHVYIKRMTRHGWAEEGEAEGKSSSVDLIIPPSALELEVRRYHSAWRPHERADVIFERMVNKEGL